MNALLRVRVPKKLLKESSAVAEELGTTIQEIARMCLAQVVKRRAVPFEVTAEPAAQEYGATAADIGRATRRITAERLADQAAGRAWRFKGALPADES